MRHISQIKPRFSYFLLGLTHFLIFFMAQGARAESRFRVCNQTTREVTYADALEDPASGITTTGWYRLAAGNCSSWSSVTSPTLYVAGHTQALAWNGTHLLCVDHDSPTGFSLTHADTISCDGTGQSRYGFQKIELTLGDNTFTFKEGEASRIGYTLTVCNRSSETVNFALGVETSDGTYSDGWYSIESDKCRVMEERGKFEIAYINGNSPGDLLEWNGPKTLCVSWNKPFFLSNIDPTTCNDGDSKLRGFLTIPLTGGVGHYDFFASEATKHSVGLNLCNSTPMDLYAAYVVQDTLSANGLISNGWIHIRSNECVLASAVMAGPVYLYAEDADGFEVWDGTDLQACIHDYNAFTIPLADTVACTNPGQSRHGFQRWDVGPGANVYTFK